MLFLEFIIVAIPYIVSVWNSWFFDTYTSVGVPLPSFLCEESSSVS